MPAVQTQDLYFSVTGQTLVFDAPSRPASVTSVSVFAAATGDDGTAETATTGSASVDSYSSTFDSNSGKSSSNPRLLNVAATAGLVKGRQYLATDAGGATEWVEVDEIVSGASCTSRSNLNHDYVSGNTFVSTRCSISVLAAWIQSTAEISDGADPNPGYRIRWVWVDSGSVTHVDFTHCDIVRYRGADHGVTSADMVKHFDAWLRLLPQNARADSGQALIDAAYERFEDDLTAMDLPDQQLRNKDLSGRMVRYGAVRELMYQRVLASGGPDAEAAYNLADADYQGWLNKLYRVTMKSDVGVTTAGDGIRTSSVGVWSR